jgi:hypothetical protein
MSRKMLLVSSALLAAACSGQALAAEGKYDGQSCYVGQTQVIAHADGFLALSGLYTGTTPSGLDGRQFSSRCVGSVVVTGDQVDINGACEYVDKDGDKYLGVFARKGDAQKVEGTWRTVHGTGKYAGITGNGNWFPTSFPPNGVPGTDILCSHEWGTYKY